ncbi:MAG: hypothetical protein ACLQU1_28495 [Bryobacteraceae bacterium]
MILVVGTEKPLILVLLGPVVGQHGQCRLRHHEMPWLLQVVPFKPTVIVYTGGGIQPYWLFMGCWELDSDKERKKAKALSKAFQKYLQHLALDRGWAMDGTADLCRLLGLPGAYNRKQAEPVLVRYEVIGDGHRYNPSDFEDFLTVEADPELKAHVQGPAPEQPSSARAEFLRVRAGCPWIRHCKDDAASLPEPEWYRLLGIVGRCKDGEHLTHELSRPYPKYSEVETTEKLKQAMGAGRPPARSSVATWDAAATAPNATTGARSRSPWCWAFQSVPSAARTKPLMVAPAVFPICPISRQTTASYAT